MICDISCIKYTETYKTLCKNLLDFNAYLAVLINIVSKSIIFYSQNTSKLNNKHYIGFIFFVFDRLYTVYARENRSVIHERVSVKTITVKS